MKFSRKPHGIRNRLRAQLRQPSISSIIHLIERRRRLRKKISVAMLMGIGMALVLTELA